MTKRERIEELEREVAELKARQPVEYHYHYDRPAYYGNPRCVNCGANIYALQPHFCWTVAPNIGVNPYWNTSGTVTTSGYSNVTDALSWNGAHVILAGAN